MQPIKFHALLHPKKGSANKIKMSSLSLLSFIDGKDNNILKEFEKTFDSLKYPTCAIASESSSVHPRVELNAMESPGVVDSFASTKPSRMTLWMKIGAVVLVVTTIFVFVVIYTRKQKLKCNFLSGRYMDFMGGGGRKATDKTMAIHITPVHPPCHITEHDTSTDPICKAEQGSSIEDDTEKDKEDEAEDEAEDEDEDKTEAEDEDEDEDDAQEDSDSDKDSYDKKDKNAEDNNHISTGNGEQHLPRLEEIYTNDADPNFTTI